MEMQHLYMSIFLYSDIKTSAKYCTLLHSLRHKLRWKYILFQFHHSLRSLHCNNLYIFFYFPTTYCVKNVHIRSYSGPLFFSFGSPYPVRIRENKDQKNSEYGHFLRSNFHYAMVNPITTSVPPSYRNHSIDLENR